MAYGVIHCSVAVLLYVALILSGLAVNPLGLVVACILAFVSHWWLDSMNFGHAQLSHNLPKREKEEFIALQIVFGLGIAWWCILHPWSILVVGCAAALDIDHLLAWWIPKKWSKHTLHRWMWQPWMRQPSKAVIAWTVIILILAVSMISWW